MATITLTISGKPQTLTIALPAIAEQEELVSAFMETEGGENGLRRCMAAMIGLCTPVGKLAGASYAKHGCNPLTYGGEIYSWLRSKKTPVADVVDAGGVIVNALISSLGLVKESEEKADFTEAPVDASTGN